MALILMPGINAFPVCDAVLRHLARIRGLDGGEGKRRQHGGNVLNGKNQQTGYSEAKSYKSPCMAERERFVGDDHDEE